MPRFVRPKLDEAYLRKRLGADYDLLVRLIECKIPVAIIGRIIRNPDTHKPTAWSTVTKWMAVVKLQS